MDEKNKCHQESSEQGDASKRRVQDAEDETDATNKREMESKGNQESAETSKTPLRKLTKIFAASNVCELCCMDHFNKEAFKKHKPSCRAFCKVCGLCFWVKAALVYHEWLCERWHPARLDKYELVNISQLQEQLAYYLQYVSNVDTIMFEKRGYGWSTPDDMTTLDEDSLAGDNEAHHAIYLKRPSIPHVGHTGASVTAGKSGSADQDKSNTSKKSSFDLMSRCRICKRNYETDYEVLACCKGHAFSLPSACFRCSKITFNENELVNHMEVHVMTDELNILKREEELNQLRKDSSKKK